jgi:hypothetical protein
LLISGALASGVSFGPIRFGFRVFREGMLFSARGENEAEDEN